MISRFNTLITLLISYISDYMMQLRNMHSVSQPAWLLSRLDFAVEAPAAFQPVWLCSQAPAAFQPVAASQPVGFSAGRLFSRKQATAFQPATYIDFTNNIRIVLLSLLFRIIFKTIYF